MPEKNNKKEGVEEKKKNNKNAHPIYARTLTFGQKAADKLTRFAGSWTFILLFLFFTIVWIIVNAYVLLNYGKDAFDPYPFILLNLALSCLAAIQAPVILMSQNRQAERDRIRTEYDYAVNRKAERGVEKLQKEIRSIKRVLEKKKR